MVVLKPKDITITLCANDTPVADGEVLSTKEYEMVNLCVTITNTREENVDNIVLAINPYQECRRTASEMKQLCAPSGCLYKCITTLAPAQTLHHSCGLLFMYGGKFVVDVSCHIDVLDTEQPSTTDGFPLRSGSMSQHGLRRATSLSPRHKYPLLCKQKPQCPGFWEQTVIVDVKPGE